MANGGDVSATIIGCDGGTGTLSWRSLASSAKAITRRPGGVDALQGHVLIKPAAFESWFPPAQRDVVFAWVERPGCLIKDKRRGVRTLQWPIQGMEGRWRHDGVRATLIE